MKILIIKIIFLFTLIPNIIFADTVLNTQSIRSTNVFYPLSMSPIHIKGNIYLNKSNISFASGSIIYFENGSIILDQSSLNISSSTIYVRKEIDIGIKASSSIIKINNTKINIQDSLFLNSEKNSNINITNSTFLPETDFNMLSIFDIKDSILNIYKTYINDWNYIIIKGNNGNINIFNSNFKNNFEVLYNENGVNNIKNNLFENNYYTLGFKNSSSTISNNKFIDNKSSIITPDINVLVLDNDFNKINIKPYTDTNNLDNQNDNLIIGNVKIINTINNNNCCSNIIFLPGLMGSRLYKQDYIRENQLWEPNRNTDVKKLFLDKMGKGNIDIYTKDIIGNTNYTNGLLDKNLYNDFELFLKKLKNNGNINDYIINPYDWRYSADSIIDEGIKINNNNKIINENLIDNIIKLASSSKTKKVNIISHSNGGLITKSLLIELDKRNLSNLIDKVIMIAMPEYGTPQAISALLFGHSQSILNGLILKSNVAKALGQNMPSSYMLLPTDKYLNNKSLFFNIKEVNSSLITKNIINNHIDLNALLKRFDINAILLSKANQLHNIIDNYKYNYEIHQILGYGLATVSGIEVFDNKLFPIYDNDGDGTVQHAVKNRTGKIYNLNLKDTDYNHINIMNYEKTNNIIENILNNKSIIDDKYFNTMDIIKKLRIKSQNMDFNIISNSLNLSNTYNDFNQMNANEILNMYEYGLDYIDKDINNIKLEIKNNNILTIEDVNDNIYYDLNLLKNDELIINKDNILHENSYGNKVQIFPNNKSSININSSNTSNTIISLKNNLLNSNINNSLKRRYINRIDKYIITQNKEYLNNLIIKVKNAISNINNFGNDNLLSKRYATIKYDYNYILQILEGIAKL